MSGVHTLVQVEEKATAEQVPMESGKDLLNHSLERLKQHHTDARGKYAPQNRVRRSPQPQRGPIECLQAIVHRYRLIADNDLRLTARQFDRPVYYLAGLVDPLVPWFYVRWWLRKNCPGYRSGKTMWRADHNVLGTAPKASAELVVQWLNAVTAVTEEAKQLPGIAESQCE